MLPVLFAGLSLPDTEGVAERNGDYRAKSAKLGDNERRQGIRYPVALDVRYGVACGCERTVTGSGRTVDFSRSGLHFLADRPLPPGTSVELWVDWPSMLEGGVRLQLVARATVVWSAGLETGVRLRWSEFRAESVQALPYAGA